mmetsp:Transcript_49980/g.107119  ORF Transcript_49980/g.107119 Transcript_49980/m.107119 type:complete len:203 (+) Transcript_49980:2716-3324(+)
MRAMNAAIGARIEHGPIILGRPYLTGTPDGEGHDVSGLRTVAIYRPCRDVVDCFQHLLIEAVPKAPALVLEFVAEDPGLHGQLLPTGCEREVHQIILEHDKIIFIARDLHIRGALSTRVECQCASTPGHKIHHANLPSRRESHEVPDLLSVYHLFLIFLHLLEQRLFFIRTAARCHQHVGHLAAEKSQARCDSDDCGANAVQ